MKPSESVSTPPLSAAGGPSLASGHSARKGQRTRPESRQRASLGLGVAREPKDHVAVALARRAHEAQLVFITIRPLRRFKGELPTLLLRLRNRCRVTRYSEIDHGVRSPWSIGSRSRWPRSRSGSK